MSSLPRVATAIQHVLRDIPDEVARSTGFLKRRSKVTAARFVQTLVLGWWQHPDATVDQLSQTSAALGVPLSPQGLDQRFGPPAAALLRERVECAVAQVMTAEPVAAAIVDRFSAVYLLDSTTVALPDALATLWPGCGGRVDQGSQAALKATVRWELVRGGLEGPVLSACRAQDKSSSLQSAPMPAAALRVADQGFWSLAVLHQIEADGGYFLSRLHQQTTVFIAGRRVDLGLTARLALRLVAARVPQEVADRRRATLRAAARREGTTPNARASALADWTLLVTNVPADRLTVHEALVLGRLRWQIELLFKLWKSGGGLAESRSTNPWRVLCELYAKLIALLIQHWVLLVGCWQFADRSLIRAATVRDWVPCLLLGLARVDTLDATLKIIVRSLAAGCRIQKRRKSPSAFQLLADPSLSYP